MRHSATKSYPSQLIEAECTVIRQIAPAAYFATLPNGKGVIAFLQRRETELLGSLRAGEKVRAIINPADFDRARVLCRA